MTLRERWQTFVTRRQPPPRETVRVDGDEVVRSMRDGRTESVRWGALRSVDVVTTSDGPFGDDWFWILRSDAAGCAVPGTAIGADGLLERLQALPGFDNEAVLRAAGCTDDATFPCWRSTSLDAADPSTSRP